MRISARKCKKATNFKRTAKNHVVTVIFIAGLPQYEAGFFSKIE
jgi:hypothetical protein